MDPAQLQPGHRLDRYELLCPLAYGGMASVWLARFGGRRGFERLVVVKMILPQYSQDPRFQEMFLDEARIASRIEHANVARILDVGEQDETTFIVMEWVDGDSLSKVARAAEQQKQRIPAGVALRVCADAAAGLHAAHDLKDRYGTSLGVVHRDVSPQNILISNAGSTVLIDFGVAKARDRVSQDTSAGQLKGKIRYMAPEQALGRSTDHRADVWSLGAILYELFTGIPPYDGPNEVATLHKLTSGVVPAPLPPHVAPPVRAIIERALASEAGARYSTALELSLSLEEALLAINQPTTTAVVAQYTGQLLADRKAARKRAVDTALTRAYARDADRASSAQITAPTPGVPMRPIERGSSPSQPDLPGLPGPPGHLSHPGEPMMGPMGLSETPSTTSSPSVASSVTLGSASMEYPHPPEPLLGDDEPTRRRRFIAAAVLGVSVAAGLIGAILIISTAILRPRDGARELDTSRNAAPATAAPLEATDPPPSANGTAGSATISVTATDGGIASALTAEAPLGSAIAPASTASPRPAAAIAPTPPTNTPPSSGAGAHHPATPAAPRPRPPTPATAGRPPDRGF